MRYQEKAHRTQGGNISILYNYRQKQKCEKTGACSATWSEKSTPSSPKRPPHQAEHSPASKPLRASRKKTFGPTQTSKLLVWVVQNKAGASKSYPPSQFHPRQMTSALPTKSTRPHQIHPPPRITAASQEIHTPQNKFLNPPPQSRRAPNKSTLLREVNPPHQIHPPPPPSGP